MGRPTMDAREKRVLKLALVSRRFPPLIGGAEKVFSYLAGALAEEGQSVTVLTSRLGVEDLPASESLTSERGSLEIVRLGTSGLRFLGTYLHVRNLRTWLKRNRPDLVYVSMLKHDAFAALEGGRRWGFPVVLRPEGAGATGDIAWQSWGRFGRRIGRRCREASAVVAISKTIREELLANGYDRSRVVDLPNGVPVPEVAWQPHGSFNRPVRAIYVGRLAPEKGIDLLVEAWADVARAQPGAHLTLVGEGPSRQKIEAQIKTLGLSDAVHFTGAVRSPEYLLYASDMFVLPSREEGMSVALLEAMALGLPLVATAIPGNRRLVGDFRHGRLSPPGQPAALSRTILEHWGDYDRAVKMGKNARSLVQQKYSIKAVARSHMELFRELLNR